MKNNAFIFFLLVQVQLALQFSFAMEAASELFIDAMINASQPGPSDSSEVKKFPNGIEATINWWDNYLNGPYELISRPSDEALTCFPRAKEIFLQMLKTELTRELVNKGRDNIWLKADYTPEGLLGTLFSRASLHSGYDGPRLLPCPCKFDMFITLNRVYISTVRANSGVIWECEIEEVESPEATTEPTEEERYASEFMNMVIANSYRSWTSPFDISMLEEAIGENGTLIAALFNQNTIFLAMEFHKAPCIGKSNTDAVVWNEYAGGLLTNSDPLYFSVVGKHIEKISIFKISIDLHKPNKEYLNHLQLNRKDILQQLRATIARLSQNGIRGGASVAKRLSSTQEAKKVLRKIKSGREEWYLFPKEK